MASLKKTGIRGVYKKQLKNDVSFIIKFYTPDGQHFTLRVGRERRNQMTPIKAEQMRQAYMSGDEVPPGYVPLKTGDRVNANADRPTFDNLAKLYWQIREKELNKGKQSGKGLRTDKGRFEKYLTGVFGHMTPEELTRKMVRAFVEGSAKNGKLSGGIRDNLSDATVDKITGLLTWIDNATAEHFPHRKMGFQMPKYQTAKDRKQIAQTIDGRLTRDELKKLVSVAYDLVKSPVEKLHRAALLIILAANVGCRKTALISLRWERVDFKARTFVLSQGVIKSGGHVFQMNDNVFKALSGRWERELKPTSGFVFPSLKGGHTGRWTRTDAYIWEIYKRADLGHLKGSVRPLHGIRHRAAKTLVEDGAPLKVIQAFMGHDSIAATMIYTDVDEHGKKESVKILNDIF